jgi:hypothetical protein
LCGPAVFLRTAVDAVEKSKSVKQLVVAEAEATAACDAVTGAKRASNVMCVEWLNKAREVATGCIHVSEMCLIGRGKHQNANEKQDSLDVSTCVCALHEVHVQVEFEVELSK